MNTYKIDIKLSEEHFKRGINFDMLMTMYCLSISDGVIINIKGETFD